MNCPFHPQQSSDMPRTIADAQPKDSRRISRRKLLGGMFAATTAATAAAVASSSATAEPKATEPRPPEPNLPESYPFEGEHQAGIDKLPQKAGMVAAFDVHVRDRAGLIGLFTTISDRARALMKGAMPAPDGIVTPASDSGELGWAPPADGLTITVGVGETLFDDRFGLKDKKPAHLTRMEAFADDELVENLCHGDIAIQICAHSHDTMTHALRDILRHTRGEMSIRWRQSGYQNPPRPSGTQRNHLGFKDGIVNPRDDEFDTLVWAGADEPEWARGGSYMAVRLITMFTEFWDRISIAEQEQIFGRERGSGGPLSGGDEWANPIYADDAEGDVIPTDAHIRLANPRTDATANQLMLRRAYNYDNGIQDNGNLDMGLIFICFQQNLERQFITVQKRLAGEPLADYIRPFGGGYFFILPGVQGEEDYLGSTLLETD